MHLGKSVRLERIFNRETKRAIIVPMDHGVSVGPMEGIIDMRKATSDMAEGGADAVLMHKGLVRCSHRASGKDVGLSSIFPLPPPSRPRAIRKRWSLPWKRPSSSVRTAFPSM